MPSLPANPQGALDVTSVTWVTPLFHKLPPLMTTTTCSSSQMIYGHNYLPATGIEKPGPPKSTASMNLRWICNMQECMQAHMDLLHDINDLVSHILSVVLL